MTAEGPSRSEDVGPSTPLTDIRNTFAPFRNIQTWVYTNQ